MIFQGSQDRFGSVFIDLNTYTSALLSQYFFTDINPNISKIMPKKLQFLPCSWPFRSFWPASWWVNNDILRYHSTIWSRTKQKLTSVARLSSACWVWPCLPWAFLQASLGSSPPNKLHGPGQGCVWCSAFCS